MTTSEPSNSIVQKSLPDESLGWDIELDKYVLRIEKAYSSRSETNVNVDLAQFVPQPDHPRYADIVRELIRVDMELSANDGVVRGTEYYRQKFGDLLEQESFCRELDFEQNRLAQESHSAVAKSSSIEQEYPSLGQDLCGFFLESELGRGSFGRVYLARESGLANRRVVLKVSSQFPGEAELLSKLQHKNIVPIYSLHQHNQWHVVCMPLLGTTTLSGLLKAFAKKGQTPASGVALVDTIKNCTSETWERKGLPSGSARKSQSDTSAVVSFSTSRSSANQPRPSDLIQDELLARLRERFKNYSYGQAVLWILAQLADGLTHAHERNILHRDLKPANILLSDDALPMLLDFNLATEELLGGSSSQVVGGTPRYMAPEQLREVITNTRLSDARSDVFSLGVILFEMLSLRPPFPDRNLQGRESLERMLDERQVVPNLAIDKSTGITSSIVAIVTKSLQFDPQARYQTAQDLLQDIQCELNNQPLQHAAGETLRDRLRKWNRRHPRLSTTTLVASAASIVLLAASMGMYLQNRRVAQLQAVNWLADAKSSRGIAQGLLSSAELPTEQMQAMLKSCDSALQQLDQVDLSRLNDAQASEGKQLTAQLLLLRARGNARMATWQADAEISKKMLASAADDARRASAFSADHSNSAKVFLDAIQNVQQQSTGKVNPVAEISADVSAKLTLTAEQIRDAMAAMKSCLATDANNPWYWTNLAQLQLETKDKDSARASLQVALNLDTKLPWPSLMLGTIELDHNKFREAKDLLNQTLQLDQQSVDAYLNRALANIGLGDLPSALEDLNEIESYAVQNPRILFVRELVYRRLGKQSEADKDRDQAMQIPPRDARSWNARGEARLRIRPADPEGALDDFRQASLTSPSLRNSYENMAHVLSEYLNRPTEAIAALDDAIECDSNYALAWSSRSVLHARVGNVEAAVSDAQQALRLERSPIVCYQAASAYAIVRRDAKDELLALSLLKETVRQNPALAEMMKNDKDLIAIKDQKILKQIISAASQLK